MTSTHTQLTSQDKGKILAYTETLNATQIAKKKWNEILPQYIGWPPALNNDEKDALVNEVTKIRRAPLHEIINKLDELKTALSEEWSKFDVSILRSVVKQHWMQREDQQSIN
ncbi:5468_t:CDS:2 [Diversispora eburnea]|uniref:5468_t:CDS:1 n=1 Tax=Diversispora eburnea TaxID=1213867 RepID=A0A9N8YW08_9GLOM|nr:5468_t:CDS:2 [Diversispora eburnea]